MLKWLFDGDRNTAFFHQMVKLRKASRGIPMLEIDGHPTTGQTIIGNHILEFYKDLFANNYDCSSHYANFVTEVVPRPVTYLDNEALNRMPSMKEIREVVFSLDPRSTLNVVGTLSPKI